MYKLFRIAYDFCVRVCQFFFELYEASNNTTHLQTFPFDEVRARIFLPHGNGSIKSNVYYQIHTQFHQNIETSR